MEPVSRHDVFLSVAGRRGVTPGALAASLWVPDPAVLQPHLDALVAEGLLARAGPEYRAAESPRAALLFRTLSYALAYEYDYNAWLAPPFPEFLRLTYDLDVFTVSDVPKALLTPEVLGRLLEDGLLLAFRYSPFMGRVVRNPFLDGVVELLGIKPVRRLFPKRVPLDTVIGEKLMAVKRKDMEQISLAARLLWPPGAPRTSFRPTQVQKIVKFDLVPQNRDLFDPQVPQQFREALARMHAHVQDRKPLGVELIREYHGLLMRGTDFAGVIRTAAVHVPNNPNFRTAAPKAIPGLLDRLVAEYQGRRRTVKGLPDILAMAAFVYNEFLHIHPFEDGNSRTARLLLAHVLREHRAGFEEVPPSFEVRFLQVTKGYKKRDDRDLLELLKEILIFVLNREELARAREIAG